MFTDGSALGNSSNAPAGSAVWFPELNKLFGKSLFGTNNQAELEAMRMGLWYINKHVLNQYHPKEVRIYSDSAYVIGVVSGKNKAKANKELIEQCKQYLSSLNLPVQFIHVDAHTADTRKRPTENDEYMTKNNKIADHEANRRAEIAKAGDSKPPQK